MSRPICNALAGRIFVCLLICLSLFAEAAHANVAGPRITIGQAKWAQGVFSVKGTVRHGAAASVDIYDSSGRLLGQATVDSRHRFALSRTDLDRPELLCSVRAKATDAMATAAVKGRPKSCGKVPQCKIFSPVGSVATTVNTDVSFSAKATLKDKKANPLKMEWDFGGGSMGEAVPGATPATFLRPTGTETTVQFVRDNGRYRARFTAWDQRNRYCEDSVEVIVGTPPDTLEEFAATRDAVAGLAESARQSAPGLAGAGSGKVVLPFEDWTLQNITDARTAPNLPTPFGPQVNTINAVVYGKAKMPVVLGDDSIELSYSAAANPADPAGKDSINTTSQNWPVDRTLMQAAVQKSDFFEVWSGPADVTGWSYAGRAAAFRVFDPLTTVPDEGYHNPDLIPALNPDHGRYMPGIGGPYAVNEPQAFSEFVADSNGFAAKMLPVTDIDDLGRVNPYPLFRVTAKDKATGAADSTDLVLTAGRDLHCRECHAKGGIGARAGSAIHHHDHSGHGDGTAEFFEPASSSLFDQEYAALRNVMVIHGLSDFATGPLSKTCADSGCHKSAIATVPYGQTLPGQESSIRVHGFHGVLQYNAARDDIQRDDQGLPVRFKPAQTDAAAGSNPNSLFPVKDAEGHILPMEQNCLRCHAGLREQCYRDRMYGAAVTCYQCHGDMLAVAGSYPKSSFSPDGNAKREAWIDQPDCASCHIGTGNRGKLGTDGFFSAGVLRTAFDETDPSATPRRPDRFNPDEGRFAVTPVTDIKLVELGNGELLPFSVALFRQGKDRHGQVPCAACHGAAHAVWPNRDPNANDNVTALQLQGHAGPIAAC
ncbi:MAG: cytochrome C, partial [Methylococcaceae bacterium]|nr:cytochrome C [Methylococcaceae bacterium]